jgi:hypothetical protein
VRIALFTIQIKSKNDNLQLGKKQSLRFVVEWESGGIRVERFYVLTTDEVVSPKS